MRLYFIGAMSPYKYVRKLLLYKCGNRPNSVLVCIFIVVTYGDVFWKQSPPVSLVVLSTAPINCLG